MTTRRSRTAAADRDHLRKWLFPAIIVIVTLLALWPVCGFEYTTWDDPQTVAQNPTLDPVSLKSLRTWWTTANLDLWDPVTDMVRGALALVARTDSPDPTTGSRLNPFVFHTANLLIHVSTALLVYQVLLLLLSASPADATKRKSDGPRSARAAMAAGAGALAFALHPVQVEAVAWITALKDLLCVFFSMLAIWRYLAHRQKPPGKPPSAVPSRWNAWDSFLFFILATLSKPTAAVVPLIVLVLARLVLDLPRRPILRDMGIWMVLALPCILITKWVQSSHIVPHVAYWQRPVVALDALAFYLFKLAWPWSLGLEYGRTPARLFASQMVRWTWIAPVLLAGVVARHWRRWPSLAAGALIFSIGLLPVLGLIPFDFQRYSTVSDHYLYLSMFGVALAVSSFSWRSSAPATMWVVFILIGGLALRSFAQTWTWRDSVSLFTHALEVNPRSAPALNSLAVIYQRRGELDTAIRLARQSTHFAPDEPEGYVTLGAALAGENRIAEATAAYRDALRRNPRGVPALNNLCGILAMQGQLAEAEPLARRAIEVDPGSPDAHLNLGTMLGQERNWPGAVSELQQAVQLAPRNPAAHANLGAVLAGAGRRDEAIAEFREALAIDPNFTVARRGLAHLGLSP